MTELIDLLTIPVGIIGLIAWIHVLKEQHRRIKAKIAELEDKTDEHG